MPSHAMFAVAAAWPGLAGPGLGHEIGHALGLQHQTTFQGLMNSPPRSGGLLDHEEKDVAKSKYVETGKAGRDE